MRKIYSLFIYCFVLIILAACETEGEVTYTGYVDLTYSIVYPEDSDTSDYTVTFNG